MSGSLSTPRWLEFLTAPLPMPGGRIDNASLDMYEKRQVRAIIENALLLRVLPSSLLLVQFVHVIPEDLKIKFEITTAVNKTRKDKLIGATAYQGAFVKRSNTSFFESASRVAKEQGLLVIVSQKQLPLLKVEFAECLYVGLDNCEGRTPSIPRMDLTHIETESIPGTKFAFVSERGISDLIERVAETSDEKPPGLDNECRVATSAKSRRRLQAILGSGIEGYFAHIYPLTSLGNVIMCVPTLYSFDEGTGVNKNLGGGGCLFVINEEINEDTLRQVYVITHKLCGMVSAIVDIALVSSKQEAEEAGVVIAKQMAETLAHEYLNTSASVKASLRKAWQSSDRDGEVKLDSATLKHIGARLDLMGVSIQGLSNLFNIEEKESLIKIIHDLRKVASKMEFPFDVEWDGDKFNLESYPIPKAFRLVLAEIFRNALDEVNTLPKEARSPTILTIREQDSAVVFTLDNPVSKTDKEIGKKVEQLNAVVPEHNRVPFRDNKSRSLGVSICKNIVSRSDGELFFEGGSGRFRAVIIHSNNGSAYV